MEGIEILSWLAGGHSLAETWSVAAGSVIFGPLSSPISPVASGLIILASAGLFLCVDPAFLSLQGRRAREVTVAAGILITLAGFTLVLSYFYGNPMFSGTPVIPIAALSALAAFFTGAGLVAAAGPSTKPVCYFIGNSIRATLLRNFVFLTVAITLGENIIFTIISSWFDISNAIMISAGVVIFIIATACVVARLSGGMGLALDRAERALVHKNEELSELNEELRAAEEELRQNIDELSKKEQDLRESEARLTQHIDNSPLAVIGFDSRFRITLWSDEACRMFGWAREEVLGKAILDLHWVYEEDAERVLAISSDMVSGKSARNMHSNRNYRKDGTVIDCEWYNSALRDTEGNLISIHSQVLEVTARKKTEQALKDREESLVQAHNELEARVRERTMELKDAVESLGTERHRLYDVLEALPVYVCLLDRDYRIPFANKYFRETFREPEGRRCYEFLFNRTEPCETCETYTVMRTRAPHHWSWTGPNGRDYDIYDFPFTDTDGSFMVLEMGIDITERKKAEDEWAILASIVEHSEDAIIGKSLAGIIMSWNAGAEKIYGYPAEEAIGRHVSMLVPPDVDDDLGYILDRIRKGVPIFQYDTVRMKKDGSLIQVSLTVSPIKDRNGELIGASTIARDISERKKAEKAIEKANAYNRSLIEASLDPLVTINPDGTISDVNEATIQVTGFSRDELIGTDFSDYFTEPAKAKTGYLDAFRDGRVTDYVLEIRNRNGHVTPVLYNATVYRDALGTVIGVFASARDITERKKAEEAIQKANAYNRSLIETSLDPLVTINPDGTINDVNEATIRVTGFSRDELIGTDFSDYFTEPEKAKAGYEKVFRDGAVTDYELEIRNRNGQVTPVLYNASVYRDTPGNIIGVFASARDITERKKAEEAIRKAHDLLEKRVKERTSELVQSNAQLKEEISQRRVAESLVKKTVSELHAAIESTADGIYVVDRAGQIIRYNQNFASMWKIPDELLRSGEDRKVSGYLRTLVKNPGLFNENDGHFPPKDRETYDMLELMDGRIFERYSKPQKMDSSIIGRVLSYRDVTDRRHAEEKLIASLQEKEILIREIHHRVKNNLQIISGLLDMTRMRTKDTATTEILTDMMMKIKTMAQIHTRLYESKQVDKINMGGQIRDQVVDLSNIYGRSGPEITCQVDAEELNLPVDQAIPCALVVNEALSNSFKHAFKGKRQGSITVTARREEGMIHIRIQDDGIGIPGDVDINRATSLGLKLVRNLVQQLRGTLTIESTDPGTAVNVSFPLATE
ncbi:MAG: PAS domain S-box protein [Methanoregula sp.]|nr:PAS domain S-box protein [Methanoregula sp.]